MPDVASPSRRAFLSGRRAPPAPADRRLAHIGDTCLAHQGVACRNCGEACPHGALRFRPRLGGAALPELDAAACDGCGECLSPCPVGAVALEAAP